MATCEACRAPTAGPGRGRAVRALISVYDKNGLADFARVLAELGVELVASGGTAAFLQEHGIECRPVEELTEVPELLGGRVKTLHPRIHAGILARRDRDDDLAALAEHEIEPFDLVVVNLYPFHREPGVELIDIGGPAMLRAAAKNFEHVAAASSAEDYDGVLSELRESGAVSPPTRARLAAKAFAHTSSYDAAITDWLEQEEPLRARLAPVLEKELELAYGENPHQAAAYYRVVGASQHLLSEVAQVH